MNFNAASPAPMLDGINCSAGATAYSRVLDCLAGRPTMRFKEMIKVMSIGRSQAYVLKKADPNFPQGVPLYDGKNSPQFYWTHEVIAWLQGRADKVRTGSEGK